MACKKPSVNGFTTPFVAVTTDTNIWSTTSTTTLKIMGGCSPPWVTPRRPLKEAPKYPPALDTIVKSYQYLHRRRRARGPTPYATMMSSVSNAGKIAVDDVKWIGGPWLKYRVVVAWGGEVAENITGSKWQQQLLETQLYMVINR